MVEKRMTLRRRDMTRSRGIRKCGGRDDNSKNDKRGIEE
jgi:hypothetical protein